jgi:signal transduction histidine kinase
MQKQDKLLFDKIKKELADNSDNIDKYYHLFKLASIGNMIGGIAHTFNNILGGILGYSQLQKEELKENENAFRHAEIIEKAAKRASTLISQLQMLSVRQQYRKVYIDPKKFIENIVEILKSVYNRSINVTVKYEHGNAQVVADPILISYVILNIAMNSKEAMPLGGSVTIRTGLTSCGNAQGDGSEDDSVFIEIKDTGSGIISKQLALVFEPFYTTKEGSGMGLTIAQEIIRDHDGQMKIESEVEKGTNVMITLPLQNSMATSRNKSKKNHRAAGQNNRFSREEVFGCSWPVMAKKQ